MQKYIFRRPQEIPFPSVWHEFTLEKEGETVNLTVQDLTDDLVEHAMELMNIYYNRDEVASKCVDVLNHPIALEDLNNFWRNIIQQKLSLVCVVDRAGCPEKTPGTAGTSGYPGKTLETDGRPGCPGTTPGTAGRPGCPGKQVVGVNLIDVIHKNDVFEPWESSDLASQLLQGSYELVAYSCNVFQLFNVDKYLNGNGITVHPQWRKMTVACEMLKARIPLCRALGINVIATVFTGRPSQAVAKKAGYKIISEITYAEMAKYGFEFHGMDSSEASMLMAFVID